MREPGRRSGIVGWICPSLTAICLLAIGQIGWSQPADPDRTAAWRTDLDYLTGILPRVHAHAFHTLPREEFDRRAARLGDRLPDLSEAEIIVGLARLVAGIGDGHTRLEFGAGSPGVPDGRLHGFRPLPIRLHHFSDGLHVRSAAPAYGHLVGGRVLRIGDTPVADALDRAAVVAHHDNPMTARYVTALMLTRPAVLYALGLSPQLSEAVFTVQTPEGDTLSAALLPADSTEDAGAVDARRSGPLPLHERRRDRNYWVTRLDDGRTLYFRYRRVRNEEDEPIAEFAGRLDERLGGEGIDRLVVDLRGNDGGDGSLNRPLLHAILRHPKILERGRLFVLTDRLTFSAAMRFAVDLEAHTSAMFVGEPTGSRPNQYGEIEQFMLPRSGLRISYSSQYFQSAGPSDGRQWIGPDVAVESSMADYRAGRDPVLAAVGEIPKSVPSLTERLEERIGEQGVEEALAWYAEWRSDPIRRYRRTEEALTRVATELWLAGRPDEAEAVFEVAAEEYPRSFEAQENLGEIYAQNGRRREALDAILRSLQLNPGNGDAIGELLDLCPGTAGIHETILLLDFASPYSGEVIRAVVRGREPRRYPGSAPGRFCRR